jgi:hypothetical protein
MDIIKPRHSCNMFRIFPWVAFIGAKSQVALAGSTNKRARGEDGERAGADFFPQAAEHLNQDFRFGFLDTIDYTATRQSEDLLICGGNLSPFVCMIECNGTRSMVASYEHGDFLTSSNNSVHHNWLPLNGPQSCRKKDRVLC